MKLTKNLLKQSLIMECSCGGKTFQVWLYKEQTMFLLCLTCGNAKELSKAEFDKDLLPGTEAS